MLPNLTKFLHIISLLLLLTEVGSAPPPPIKPVSFQATSSKVSPGGKHRRKPVGRVYNATAQKNGPKDISLEPVCGTSVYSRVESDGLRELHRSRKPADVIGGQEAQPGEFPWQVKLMKEGNQAPHCGGSIMDANYIITAAHCVHNCSAGETVEPSRLTVTVGAHERDQPDHGQVHEVERVVVHEEYCDTQYRKDIALVKVAKSISFSLTEEGYGSVNSICMPQGGATEFADNEQLTLAGWGRIRYDPRDYASSLQFIQVPFVEDHQCEQLFEAQGDQGAMLNFEAPLEVCAGGFENEGSCKGDSGGPLMRDVGGALELVGVVSRGLPCATKDSPSVYAQVDAYLDWIAENTSD